jgi:hypothetical protein
LRLLWAILSPNSGTFLAESELLLLYSRGRNDEAVLNPVSGQEQVDRRRTA